MTFEFAVFFGSLIGCLMSLAASVLAVRKTNVAANSKEKEILDLAEKDIQDLELQIEKLKLVLREKRVTQAAA
ncbi:MAG TPA: hypothetical protein VHY09_14475 [Candidatus Methylacidiphilales bacterium]|jgi:hypothetical protein|nr:hypothetical protein [Candidatus Methylacidiphilales bacterium]